jgi:large subunit ribosomal protein L18
MNRDSSKRTKRISRHTRIRMRVHGSADVPRLAVYRSNTGIYAQIIDDASGKTIVAANTKSIKAKGTKSEKSALVGTEIAKLATAKKITKVVFDRGGFLYAGRVAALADAARKGGLQF